MKSSYFCTIIPYHNVVIKCFTCYISMPEHYLELLLPVKILKHIVINGK